MIWVGVVSLAAWTFSTAAVDLPTGSATLSNDAAQFFEKSVRPVLVEKCYSCHSAQAKKLKGKLRLDSRQGVAKGGENGAIIVGRDPEQSRLIQAIRWTDPDLQMPPKEKLTAQQIASLEQWVRMGAPDPRDGVAAASNPGAGAKGIDLAQGRKWWAFQPVAPIDAPAGDDAHWAKSKIDSFVLAKLRENHLEPSPAADRRTLIRRAFLDLTGLRPSYEQVEAFANDPSPDAYPRLIEQLLASPHYGERWGRYWLDVVRYGEDNFTGEATTPPFPFAWRYRDWVIDAINRDVPYDHFVKLQLAADLMPGTPRRDLVALGFLGAAPQYHKDGRLSKEVVETLYTDDWDERVDTVTRGILGLTVACARCHDHKFDPIPTADYYRLAGVFASTVAAPRPLAQIDPGAETRFMAATQRIFYLSYVANLLRDEPGTKVAEARQKVLRYTAEMERVREQNAPLREHHPEMYAYLSQLAKRPAPYPDQATTQPAKPAMPAGFRGRGRRGASTEPFFQAVFDAGLWVDGSDPDLTMTDVRPGEAHDLNVLAGGSVSRAGAVAHRGFLSVLAKGDPDFHQGSGRRELADRIFSDAAPLAARVIVNRVWAWHFGKPIVATPSDFGAQGEKPTHPQLLDDLAARFIQNGYSLKWLHRQIMLSAAYQQSSQPRDNAQRLDPANRLLWRMNPRRLDVEAYRDCLLQASGSLDDRVGGPSIDLDQPENTRRTVYGRVSRGRMSSLLQLYDFPEATMHSPQREVTTSPLQQLFVMNSGFVQDRAAALARSVERETSLDARVRGMYRRTFGREPSKTELKLGEQFLASSTPAEYAQALLCTNEEIFWP
ncbi:MAG TPA: PSD1 and planctomycete cytochrome C domain-containing protein [Tepidisphaeraceae bacterium]